MIPNAVGYIEAAKLLSVRVVRLVGAEGEARVLERAPVVPRKSFDCILRAIGTTESCFRINHGLTMAEPEKRAEEAISLLRLLILGALAGTDDEDWYLWVCARLKTHVSELGDRSPAEGTKDGDSGERQGRGPQVQGGNARG